MFTHIRTVAPEDVLITQYRPAWQEQAYLRFAKIPHRVENCAFPIAAGDEAVKSVILEKKTGDSNSITASDLPKIIDRHNVASSANTLSYMSSHLCNLDTNLDPSQNAQVIAFTTLVQKTLNIILLQSRWVGWVGDWSSQSLCSYASTADVNAAMKSHRTFPFNIFVSYMERTKACSIVQQQRLPCGILAKQKLHEGYQALETMLSDTAGPYIFGRETPCSLDAVVYGHVASARLEKTTEFGIDIELKFPKLWNHYMNITERYFVRAMAANESNNFYRLGEQASTRRRKELREKTMSKDDNNENKNTNKNKNKNDVDNGSGWFTTNNARHSGGGNEMYLPKANRASGRVGTFSGRKSTKTNKNKRDVGTENEEQDEEEEEKKDKKQTKIEKQQDKQNKLFLGFCGVTIVGYLIFSGRISFADGDEY